MQNTVSCPQCRHEFTIEAAVASDIEKKLRQEFNGKFKQVQQDLAQRQEAELKQREVELQERFRRERREAEEALEKQRRELSEQLEARLRRENEATLMALQKQLESQSGTIQELRQKELAFLQKEVEIKQKEEQFELDKKRFELQLQQELSEKIRREETERNELKFREMEKQLEDQKRLADEMRRKAEQGSMQLQGEVQELAIEEWLTHKFPLDRIEEVKKGARGGDCVQIVVNTLGRDCGKIYYESKRTKEFQPGWIEKFKADMREIGADVGVIVTQAMPKDMDRFGEREGVWICSYEEFKALCYVLRDTLLRVQQAAGVQENRGEKMSMLYDYLTSANFRMSIEAIVEAFTAMQNDLNKEKNAMQRIWKSREKQIEKVIGSTLDMFGSIKGIAGNAVQDIKMLDLDTPALLPEETD